MTASQGEDLLGEVEDDKEVTLHNVNQDEILKGEAYLKGLYELILNIGGVINVKTTTKFRSQSLKEEIMAKKDPTKFDHRDKVILVDVEV